MKVFSKVAGVILLLMLGTAVAGAAEFTSKGVKIHYTVEGKGEPVVLIHGLHSSAAMNWQLPGITAALAKEFQVIALDCRGHGQSDKPQAEDQYGEEMAEDIVRLLDHLSIKKAHVVGYSMGGMITLKLLTKHPERVQTAVLGGMGWLKSGSVLQQTWEKMPGGKGPGVPQACVRGLSRLAVSEAELKAVQVPVTVIVGDRDPVKRMYVEPLQAARADWPVKLINGAGHLNCIMKPEFSAALRAALEAKPAKAGK